MDSLDRENVYEEIMEGELPVVKRTYVCEECDYKWEVELQAKIEDTYIENQAIKVDESRIKCPVCGSSRVSHYEG